MRTTFPTYIAIAILLFSTLAIAQTPDTAIIVGQVFDLTHSVVIGVRITATNDATGLKRSAETDSKGKFFLAALPVAGSYTLTASKAGFADARVENLNLAGGRSAEMSLQLNPSAGSTVIEVTGVVGEVLTDEPQLGERIDSKQAQETLLLNRRITYLPFLNWPNLPRLHQATVLLTETWFIQMVSARSKPSFKLE